MFGSAVVTLPSTGASRGTAPEVPQVGIIRAGQAQWGSPIP